MAYGQVNTKDIYRQSYPCQPGAGDGTDSVKKCIARGCLFYKGLLLLEPGQSLLPALFRRQCKRARDCH